jgi:hypothetical protein
LITKRAVRQEKADTGDSERMRKEQKKVKGLFYKKPVDMMKNKFCGKNNCECKKQSSLQ